jgi:hypothetical protein
MDRMPVIPATFDKNIQVTNVITDRKKIIYDLCMIFIDDLTAELNITKKPICIYILYDEGLQMSNGGLLGMLTSEDEDRYNIDCFVNNIIYFHRRFNMHIFIRGLAHTLAHECRHIWQMENNKYEITGIDDKNYRDNYENIDYEIDANMFADYYLDSRTNFIRSVIIQYIDNNICNGVLTTFNIYDFFNYMNDCYKRELDIMFSSLLFDTSLYPIIIFEPLYNNGSKLNFISFTTVDNSYGIKIETNLHDNMYINSINDLVEHIYKCINRIVATMYCRCINSNYDESLFECGSIKDYIKPIILSILYDYLLDNLY